MAAPSICNILPSSLSLTFPTSQVCQREVSGQQDELGTGQSGLQFRAPAQHPSPQQHLCRCTAQLLLPFLWVSGLPAHERLSQALEA